LSEGGYGGWSMEKKEEEKIWFICHACGHFIDSRESTCSHCGAVRRTA